MAPSLEGQPRGAGCAPVGATTVCLLCREAGHERASGEAGLCGGAGRGHRPAGSLSSLLGLDTVQPRLRRPRGGGSDDRGQQGVVAVALCRSGSAWASWPSPGWSAAVRPVLLRRWGQRVLRDLSRHIHAAGPGARSSYLPARYLSSGADLVSSLRWQWFRCLRAPGPPELGPPTPVLDPGWLPASCCGLEQTLHALCEHPGIRFGLPAAHPVRFQPLPLAAAGSRVRSREPWTEARSISRAASVSQAFQ